MLLDYVFPVLGGWGTVAALLGILTLVGTPAIGHVLCPTSPLRRMSPRGR